jgi:hypothetical protein
VVDRRPSSYVLRLGDCPSFYRPSSEQFTCVPHCFPTCGGVASSAMELTAVLVNPAPVEASWRVLCLHRGGFAGGGVMVGCPAAAAGQFEGTVNGGPYVAIASGCRHSARRGAAVAGMAAQG